MANLKGWQIGVFGSAQDVTNIVTRAVSHGAKLIRYQITEQWTYEYKETQEVAALLLAQSINTNLQVYGYIVRRTSSVVWRINNINYNIHNAVAWLDAQHYRNWTLPRYNNWYYAELNKMNQVLLNAYVLYPQVKFVYDMHSPYGWTVRRNRRADASRTFTEHKIFNDNHYYNAWLQHVKDAVTLLNPNPNLYAFGPINEPACATYNRYRVVMDKVIAELRKLTKKPLMIPPIRRNINKNWVPFKRKNIIYEYHIYRPPRIGLYDGSPEKRAAFNKAVSQLNRKFFESYIQEFIDWAAKHKAKVFIGEFGCTVVDPNVTAKWLRIAGQTFNRLKWDWTIHAFNESSVFNYEPHPVIMNEIRKLFNNP